MVSCVACGRSQKKDSREKGITFHHFPKKEESKKIWMVFVNKPNWIPSKNSFLCSLHFTNDCFDRSSSAKVRLKDCANPTIVVTRIKYARSFCEENIIENVPEETKASSPTSIPTTFLEVKADDTPRKVFLKRKLIEMQKMDLLKSKKIRSLQQKNWAQERKIDNLNVMISELKEQNLLIEEYGETLLQKFGSNSDFIRRLFNKSTNQIETKSIGIQVNIETKSVETFTDYTQENKSYQTNLSEIFDRLKTELVDLHSHIEKQDIRL